MSSPTLPDRLRRFSSPALRGLFKAQGRLGGAVALKDADSVNLPDDGRPVILAANHTNSEDIPRIAAVLGRHFYVVAATDGMFGALNKLVCNAYGTIWLERDTSAAAKASRVRAQDTAIAKLRAGVDVLIFPEAVWNARPTWIDGLPMLPLYRGVIAIARAAGAHVIPVVTEYTPDHVCHVNVGESFAYDRFGDDTTAAADALRETMGRTKLALRERYGPISEAAFLDMRTAWRKAYPKWDPNREVTFIQGYNRDPELVKQWFLI